MFILEALLNIVNIMVLSYQMLRTKVNPFLRSIDWYSKSLSYWMCCIFVMYQNVCLWAAMIMYICSNQIVAANRISLNVKHQYTLMYNIISRMAILWFRVVVWWFLIHLTSRDRSIVFTNPRLYETLSRGAVYSVQGNKPMCRGCIMRQDVNGRLITQ